VARGRLLISSGTLPFTAPSYDLLSTATQLDLADAHWRMGITWEPLCPESSGTYDPCAAVVDNAGEADDDVPDPPAKTATTEWQTRAATPFTAYSRIDCSPVGQWDQLSETNQQALIRSESRFVETAFWTGVVAGQEVVFPHLAADSTVEDGADLLQPAATVVAETPLEIASGLGLLEDAMRDCYPGVATIHMPIRIAELASMHDLIEARSGRMFTKIGSKVVIGDYPGTAPDGTTDPGVTWMYATGEVFFMREPTPTRFSIAESFDRNVNTVEVIAERTYVIGWDCCLMAVPILNGSPIPV
jgi:hypothetical protein